jgi:RAB protein geranylgeranyltransferase component A
MAAMAEDNSNSLDDGIGQSHFDVTVVGTGLSESIAAS